MEKKSSSMLDKLDWLVAGVFALASAALYFATMADYVYPGESARLIALWRGLDVANVAPYPLAAFFAKALGSGNAIAPVCGTVATVAVYVLAVFFVRLRINGEHMTCFAVPASRLAGVVAALVFMLTPAVRSAATHLEPRMFDAAWALLALLVALPWSRASKWTGRLYSVVFGVMWGLGAADTPLFIIMLPLALVVAAVLPLRRGRKPYSEMACLLVFGIVAFFVAATAGTGDLSETLKSLWTAFKDYTRPDGWMMILFFTTIPFVVALFSSNKAFNEESGWVQWIFHISMGIASVIAVATPLSASSLMDSAGVTPVAASVFAAFVAGYLAAYWLLVALSSVRVNESQDSAPVATKGRFFAYVAGGALAVVYLFTALFNLFTFDSSRGEFADRIAERIISDLGGRHWIVTDGVFDDHIKILAARQGKAVDIVSLSRDLDKNYLERLSALVKERKIGGERNEDLTLSLSLGILPFVQDWFSCDPSVATDVAVFGAPDLWHSAGIPSVPEFAFFGADPARKTDWLAAWKEIEPYLEVPSGWGSYNLRKVKNPVERRRLELRRHLGFVANNMGVWLQDNGRDDEAFEMYERVLDMIDPDNICALFNAFEMAQAKHPKASARKFAYEKRLKAIVDDPGRRYRLWSLSTYYGYIRKPEVLIRLGFAWARSGRPGEALAQIRRAIDFIPTDRRSSILNMMAALYASEEDRAKSREMYEQVLARNSGDHDALIGMMRLSLMEGENEKALEFLDRAVAAGGDDPRIRVELAMAALMRQDLAQAKSILKQVTDSDSSDLRAWSLLAAVTMQQSDAAKEPAAKAVFDKELENVILPAMEAQARGPEDYYVQTTKAFLLMRKGAEKRREARDAFAVAAKARPDVAATQDLVMGLDISLDDPESAERHARDVLKRNRNSPLANYIMGSLSLRRNDLNSAELYLRKSADAKRPVVLAMNDLAEVLRRKRSFAEAERYAREAVKTNPNLYVAWETIGAVLMDAGGDLDEAQRCVEKAVELSRVDGRAEDIRMLISLARVLTMKGDKKMARVTLRKVQSRIGELSEFEKGEYDELMKNVR